MMTADQLIRLALAQARHAFDADEVPVGCVVLHEPSGSIFEGFNHRETLEDPTAHAEIVAMRAACTALNTWRLVDCTLAVTLEPCAMCAGAIVNARIPRVIYGCADPKAGAVRSLYRLLEDDRLNHRCEVIEGVMAEECAEILKAFFRKQRSMGKK